MCTHPGAVAHALFRGSLLLTLTCTLAAQSDINAIGPTEFAFLVDLDNDGKADDLLPQFTGAANAPLTWYDLKDGVLTKRLSAHGVTATA